MEFHEVIVVGGGPGGSACAARLREHGVDCLVLDRASFPRLKLCAGWITPEVVADIHLDPADYPGSFLTFPRLQIHFPWLSTKLNTTQHSIRRVEFDHWLLQRSGAPLHEHYVRKIRREGEDYILDDTYRCRFLVGAAGTKCPVYRELFREANPRARERQAVTLEEEFPYEWEDPACHLWFFEQGLPGYAWYVPKANGHLNIGIGGMAHRLKCRKDDIKRHWEHFIGVLRERGLVRNHAFDPGGYSYYLRDDVETLRLGNAFIVGDSVGLATRDLCEGIGPAIRTGQRAAEAIVSGSDYTLETVNAYSNTAWPVKKGLEYMFLGRKEKAAA